MIGIWNYSNQGSVQYCFCNWLFVLGIMMVMVAWYNAPNYMEYSLRNKNCCLWWWNNFILVFCHCVLGKQLV